MNDEISASNNHKKRDKKCVEMRRFHGSPPPAHDKSYGEAIESVNEVFYSESVEVPDLDEDLDKFFIPNKSPTTADSDAFGGSNLPHPPLDEILELDDIEQDDSIQLLNQHKRK